MTEQPYFKAFNMNFGSQVIFRQLFDAQSSTYTYLLADRGSREAVIIDPVLEHLANYLRLLNDLDLQLIASIETHTHADHITAAGRLRENTGCMTILGLESDSSCVGRKVFDGDSIYFGDLRLGAIHTPGHTNDSYTFVFQHNQQTALFTGDTLLIRGTGRTDFQHGDPEQQYRSLFEKLLTYPDQSWVYPGHDYKGWSVSTIAEERRCNPRLQVRDIGQYKALMDGLKLPNPQLMDVAVPANQACGSS